MPSDPSSKTRIVESRASRLASEQVAEMFGECATCGRPNGRTFGDIARSWFAIGACVGLIVGMWVGAFLI